MPFTHTCFTFLLPKVVQLTKSKFLNYKFLDSNNKLQTCTNWILNKRPLSLSSLKYCILNKNQQAMCCGPFNIATKNFNFSNIEHCADPIQKTWKQTTNKQRHFWGLLNSQPNKLFFLKPSCFNFKHLLYNHIHLINV